MTHRKANIFTSVGLFTLVAGLLIRLFAHGNHPHFIAGFLLGLSIVLMISGFIRRRQDVMRG